MNTLYTVTIIDTRTGGIACMNDVIVTAGVSSQPNIDNNNSQVCPGVNVNIGGAAIAGLEYLWIPSDSLDDATSANPVFSHSEPGLYEYTLVVSEPLSGCFTDTTQVIVEVVGIEGDLGGDIEFCGSSGLVAMVGVDSFPNYTYEWLSPIAANLDDPIDWATNSSTIFTTTTFILEITNEIGCTIQDTVIYTDIGGPSLAPSTLQYSCEDGTVTLGTAGELDENIYNFSWTGPGGFTSNMQHLTTTIPTGTPTPWIYTLTVTQGSDPICSTTIDWVIEPLPPLSFLPTGMPCLPNGIRIGVDDSSILPSEENNYAYMWDNTMGVVDPFFTPALAGILVYPDGPETYTITATHLPSGCEQSFTYNIVPPSNPADLGPDLIVCADELDPMIMLQTPVVGASSYIWDGTGVPFLSDTSIPNPIFDVSAALAANGSGYTHNLVILITLADGCRMTDEMTITIYGTLDEPLAGPDQTVCAEEKIMIGLPTLTGLTYTWSTVPYNADLINGISDLNIAQPTICVTETTTYEVTYTSPDGSCMNTDLVTVYVPVDNPVLDVVDIAQCANEGSQIDLNNAIVNNTGINTSFWYDPTLIAAVPNPASVSAGTYYIYTENTEGCFDVDTVMVSILPEPSFMATGIINCGDDSMSGIVLSNFDAGLHYEVVVGSPYTGTGTYSTTSPIPNDGSLGANFIGSPGGTTYTIRVFDTNGCYTDRTVTLGSSICESLPVELLTFFAEEKDCKAYLSWRTGSAIGFSHFELEQSLDGKNFEPIAKIAASSNSLEEQIFSFIQPNLKTSITYFRLQQVDLDGSFEYSDVVAVKAKCTEQDRFQIHPNPTTSLLYLEYTAATSESLQVEITSMAGVVLQNLEFELSAGKQELSLDLEDLAAGTYLIRLSNRETGEQSVERIIKAK